jgi:hypothetical protein
VASLPTLHNPLALNLFLATPQLQQYRMQQCWRSAGALELSCESAAGTKNVRDFKSGYTLLLQEN